MWVYENVLFELIGNKEKRWPGAEEGKASIFNGKMKFLLQKKKKPASLDLGLLPHRCYGSTTLVCSGQHHGLQHEEWALYGVYNPCFDRTNLAGKDESKWNAKNSTLRWHSPKNNIQIHYEFWLKMNIQVLSNTFSVSFHLQHNTCMWKALEMSTDLMDPLGTFSVEAVPVLSNFYQRLEDYGWGTEETRYRARACSWNISNLLYMMGRSWPSKNGSESFFKHYLVLLGLDAFFLATLNCSGSEPQSTLFASRAAR